MTLAEQDKFVLEVTLLKFLGSGRDKSIWLESHGWRYECRKWYTTLLKPFSKGWREPDQALDDEILHALTSRPAALVHLTMTGEYEQKVRASVVMTG